MTGRFINHASRKRLTVFIGVSISDRVVTVAIRGNPAIRPIRASTLIIAITVRNTVFPKSTAKAIKAMESITASFQVNIRDRQERGE